eukprot:15827958-Heterocapsa_arctica.AAC.1
MIGAVEDDNLERVSPSTASSRMAEQLRPLMRDAHLRAVGWVRPPDRPAQLSTVEEWSTPKQNP